MNTTRRVLLNSLLNLGASVSQRLGQALIFILIARFLSDAATGSYSLASTYSSVLLALSLWGLDQILIREIARDRERLGDYLPAFLAMRLALSVGLWLLLALLLPLLPYTPSSKTLILVMALSTIPASVANLYQAVWIAYEEVRAISALMLFFSLLRIGAGVLLLLGSPQALINIAWMLVVVSLMEMLVNALLTHRWGGIERLRLRVDARAWLVQLRSATPLSVVSLVLIVEYQLDVVILSLFHPEAEVGIYSKAALVLTLLLFLTRSYQLAIFPTISRAFTEGQQRLAHVYGRSLKYLLGGALVVALAVIAGADLLTALLYGAEAGETALIIRILVWGFVVSAFNVPNSRLLIAADRQRVMAYFAILSMVGNLLLNLWLVPSLGGVGSALARVLAMPLYSVPAFFYVQWHICPLFRRSALSAGE